MPIRQKNNEKNAHGNILSQTRGDKEAPEQSRDFPMFSNSKFIPSNSTSSLINHKQSTDAVRTSTHSSIPAGKPTPSKIARNDAASIAARLPSAQRTRPPASASRGRVASAVAATAAFAGAPTVRAPVRVASRAAAADPAPTGAPSPPAPQSRTGESKRGG